MVMLVLVRIQPVEEGVGNGLHTHTPGAMKGPRTCPWDGETEDPPGILVYKMVNAGDVRSHK